MNDDTTSVDEQDEIDASKIEHGPSVNELSNAPAADGGTEPASAGDDAGDGDGDSEPTATHTRVRIEHSDGSRSWHVEQTGDAELAERLARGRDIGTVIRSEPMETDNDGTD